MPERYFSEKINLPRCKFHRDKIGEHRISSEERKTFFLCDKCYKKFVKENECQKIKKNSSEELISLPSKIPSAFGRGISRFSSFGKESPKEEKTDFQEDMFLFVIWEKYPHENCKVFGDSIPAIKILAEDDNNIFYIFYTESGIPLYRMEIDGSISKHYKQRNIMDD